MQDILKDMRKNLSKANYSTEKKKGGDVVEGINFTS